MSIPTSSTSNRGVRGLPDESQTIDNTSRVINRADFAAYQNSLAEKAEARAQERQHARRRTLRVSASPCLWTRGSFMEMGQFVGGNMAAGFSGAAVVTGIGQVDGRPVAVYAQDFSIAGGTLGGVRRRQDHLAYG